MCSSSTSQSGIAYVPGISLSTDTVTIGIGAGLDRLYVFEVPEDSLNCRLGTMHPLYCVGCTQEQYRSQIMTGL